MKQNISNLMNHIPLEDLGIYGETPLSSQRIKELTMKKLKKEKCKRRSLRIFLIAAIIASLGITAVAADRIWGVSGVRVGSFNEDLQVEAVDTIDTLGASFPGGITNNGATITPISVLGDDTYFHLHLRVEAPEGVTLPDGKVYQFSGMGAGQGIALDVPNNAYKDKSSEVKVETLPDDDPTDNVKGFMVRWYCVDQYVDLRFNDGISKILRISGLWVQTEDGSYQQLFTGDFAFDIGRYELVELAKPEVAGLSVLADNGEDTLTLQTMTVSPLSISYTYQGDFSESTKYPVADFVIVMRDGSEVGTENGPVRHDMLNQEYGGSVQFDQAISLDQIDYILFGDHKIEVVPEPVQIAPLPNDA